MTEHHNPFAGGVPLAPTPTIPILNQEEIEARESSIARHPSSQGPAVEPDPQGLRSVNLDLDSMTGLTDLYITDLTVGVDGIHMATVLVPEISPHFTFTLPIELFGEVCRYFFTPGTSLATNPVVHIKGLGAIIDDKPTFGGPYEYVDGLQPNMADYINFQELDYELHSV